MKIPKFINQKAEAMKKLILLFGLITFDQTSYFGQTASYNSIECYGTIRYNWALVELDGKFGFIDKHGKEIVKPKYDKIWDFGIYRDNWALVSLNGKLGFIDTKGREIVEPKYDSIESFGIKHEDYAEVKINDKFALIDKRGKEVTQMIAHE